MRRSNFALRVPPSLMAEARKAALFLIHSPITFHLESARLGGTADHVKLHEVCGAANSHRRAGDDADDIPFADEAFFEEAFFGDGGEAVNFAHIRNMARHDAPDQGHAVARFRFRREGDDGHRRAVAGYEASGKSAVSEDGDQLHVQFVGSVANEFSDGFRYI